MSYTQLTQEQRYQIHALMKMGLQHTEIADYLEIHKSTTSSQQGIARLSTQASTAESHAHRNHARKRINAETWLLIEAKIRQEWSPEQISGWMKRSVAVEISHEWIYQYVLADKNAVGTLYPHLHCQKKHRKRYGSYDRRGKLLNRVSIEERSAIVDERQRIGDWEVDTIVGKRHCQAIVSLTERKSRLVLLRKVNRRKSDLVSDAVIDLLQPISERLHTITGDNGKEFAEHERISHELNTNFFFAHPFAAWERGTNENINGLVRQYIPKRREFDTISEHELLFITNRLNHRPRKCLDFRTPFEVFFEHSVALAS